MLTWRLSKALRSSLLRCTVACHVVQARCRDEAKQALLAFCTLARFSLPSITNSFQLANALHMNASQPANRKTVLQVMRHWCFTIGYAHLCTAILRYRRQVTYTLCPAAEKTNHLYASISSGEPSSLRNSCSTGRTVPDQKSTCLPDA